MEREFAATNLFALLSACWAHLPSTGTHDKILTVILALENLGTCPLILNGLEINNIRDYSAVNKPFLTLGFVFHFEASSRCLNMRFYFSLPGCESPYLFFVIKCQTLELYLPVYTGGALHVNRKSLQAFQCFFCKDRAQHLLISPLVNDPPFTQQIN